MTLDINKLLDRLIRRAECLDSNQQGCPPNDIQTLSMYDTELMNIDGSIDFENPVGFPKKVKVTPFININGGSDTKLSNIVDWGTGDISIVGNITFPELDYTGKPNGTYQIKFYKEFGSGNYLFLGFMDIDWDGTTANILSSNPTFARSYIFSFAKVQAMFTLNPFNIISGLYDMGGNPYTQAGDLIWDEPYILNELINISV